MIKNINLLILFCSFCCFGFQQNINQEQIDYLDNLYNNGAYQKVIDSIKKMPFAALKNTNDSLLYSKCLYLKANSLYGLGKFEESIISYNDVIGYSPKSSEGKNLKGMAFFDRAFSEYNIEEYLISYNSVKSAESVLSKLKNPNYDYLISIYADVSGSATSYGYFDEAEYYIKKGLDLYKKHKKEIQTDKSQASKDVLLLYKSVVLYSSQGDEKKLIKSLKSLEKIRSQKLFNATENLMYAVSLNLAGDFYLNHREKFDTKKALFKAGKYIEKALLILDEKSYPDNEIQFKFNLVKKLRYSKNFKEALLKNQEILLLAPKNDQRIPFFLAQRGIIYLENKDFKNSIKVFREMILSIHKGKNNLTKDFSNFSPSSDLNHTGLFVEIADMILDALPKNNEAINFASKMYIMGLSQFKNVYSKEEFSTKLKDYYNLTFRGILKTKEVHSFKNQHIISEIENIENKLAWKTFLQNRTLSKALLPDSLFTKEQNIREEIVDARIKNDTLLVVELNKKIEVHRNYLEKLYPKISNSLFSKFSLPDFQSKLNKNDIVLRYKFFKDDLFVFKITNSESFIFQITFKDDEKEIIEKYIRILKNGKENKEIAHLLFNKLIPFQLKIESNIFIIPDQNLHHLPFETLIDHKDNYLINNFNISYASYLVFIKQRKLESEKQQLKAFLPNYKSNLKGANEEVKKITKFFSSKLFSKELATKKSFIKNSKNASILHLAMHAKINQNKPELSYFLFSDLDEDKLYLEELYGLKLNSELAVLSACNTGSGSINNNFTLVSLQRAFNFSGVPSTVSSLWEIPDEATKEIMIYFYENLSKEMPKNRALRLAKKKYLASKTDINVKVPYYWAGLIVSGDIHPITNTSNNQFYWIILALLVAIAVVLFKLFEKR